MEVSFLSFVFLFFFFAGGKIFCQKMGLTTSEELCCDTDKDEGGLWGMALERARRRVGGGVAVVGGG